MTMTSHSGAASKIRRSAQMRLKSVVGTLANRMIIIIVLIIPKT